MRNSNSRPEQLALWVADQRREAQLGRRPSGRRLAGATRPGFTLIELLVVISIIGVLAGLVLGLAGLATRKSRESRIRTELTKLVTDIENYKAALGFYPPDHPGAPSTNQLFYELSGTIYHDKPLPPRFSVNGRQEDLVVRPNGPIETYFGSSGFGNAQRDPKELKFSTEFKGSQVKRISANPPIDVLAVPVQGRKYGTLGSWTLRGIKGEEVNPWLYVSTSPTNNPERFDLWTEVLIGGKVMRFSNWEKDAVVLSP